MHTDYSMSAITRLCVIITLGSIPYLWATGVEMLGTILSKHDVVSFTNSAIVTYKALPYSNESMLCRAESVA